MEIKSKKYINEGFNSKAYIINDEYILLEGVNKNSYDNYKKYSESLNKLVDVKSLQIPNIIELIAPNNEYSGRFYTSIPEIGNRRSDVKETALPF